MLTQPRQQVVQWQDFKVRSEADLVMEIAQQKGWKDCEIFGQGDMITQPLESKGWKLIPADLYEYSIPAEGTVRVLQIINAGVRIQGVIIADDQRRKAPAPAPAPAIVPAPAPAPAEPIVSLPSGESVGLFFCKVLVGLLLVAGCIFAAPFLLLGVIFDAVFGTDYDPKLVILVDDGEGGTLWVSVLTWYD